MGRILVTGATGFVGRALVRDFAEAGRPLTLATRGRRPDVPGDVRWVTVGSLGPETDWAEALAEVEAVIHLAAHVHVAPERASAQADTFDRVNHLGSARLFAEAARSGVGTFVFVSSVTVLGSASPPGGAFDDSSPPRPETPYARSKLEAERTLAGAADGSGTRLVILRPPLIAGEGVAGNLGSLARLAAWPVPLPLAGLRNRRTLLSRDNLVSALAAVLERPRAGTYLMGDAAPLSTSEIVRHLRSGAGGRMPLLPVPSRFLKWAARRAGLAGHAQRLLGDLVLDSRRFREAFGWADVVDSATTLRRTGAALRGPVGTARVW